MRIAMSETFRCPPGAVRAWAWSDTLDAHVVLDMLDEIRPVQEEEARRQAKEAYGRG
jgi:hypothetical protein